MDGISIIKEKISLDALKAIAKERYGDMVKCVVDVEQKIMAIGGDLHADEEAVMLENGSLQENLWGINLYPDLQMPDMVEYDSMINIRPRQNNRSRSVEDETVRVKILEVVKKLLA